jgi:hypothetical protein
MTFEKFLASKRKKKAPKLVAERGNPFAEDILADLNRHLSTVTRWLEGDIQTGKMRAAMEFFSFVFPGQFTATAGRLVYRGQAQRIFNGEPRSYSYEKWIAENFACDPLSGPFAGMFSKKSANALVIKRKVCHKCADAGAFALSLDLAKVLAIYGSHKFGIESEVVILNTPPTGKTARVWEGGCE